MAERQAAMALDVEYATLTGIRFFGPDAEYFEFVSDDRVIMVHTESLEPVPLPKLLERYGGKFMDPAAYRIIDTLWTQVTETPPTDFDPFNGHFGATNSATIPNLVEIARLDLVPVVNQTYWCVPTVITMQVGFWDNYAPGAGTIVGYGRLINCWFEHSLSHHNVPDFIDEMMDPATGSWRPGYKDLPDFLLKRFGYSFTYVDTKATAANDYAWLTLRDEILLGRPVHWAIHDPDHSNLAIGYRTTTAGKFIVCYSTWGNTAAQQRHEWSHVFSDGFGRLFPAGLSQNNPPHAVLVSPYGGETFITQHSTQIKFYVWQGAINTVTIYFSPDRGKNWSTVACNIPVKHGWNYYAWTPSIPTTQGRIQILACMGGILIAGDGSHQDFTVAAAP